MSGIENAYDEAYLVISSISLRLSRSSQGRYKTCRVVMMMLRIF